MGHLGLLFVGLQDSDGRGIAVFVHDAHDLVSIVGAGLEVIDDGRRACDLYLLPLVRGRTGIVEAEVVDIETKLVGAVEVADGDVALLAGILAQIDGLFDVLIGGDSLGQYDIGEVSHLVSSGGDIDGKMLFEIVGILSFHPHLQYTIEW